MSSLEKVDGRRERTKRTRAAIVTALTELLDEGKIEPTAQTIAERAGVALRSIGQHFASREELLLAVAEHHAARLPRVDVAATGAFEDRLARFVEVRARVLEASRAMRSAAGVMLGRSRAVAAALQQAADARRAETRRVFAKEITESENALAAERTAALATSGRTWDAMRLELGLGAAAAKAQMAAMLRDLLGARSV